MSGWLNLNESLNSLKGQISNFANNVLSEDDEGTEPTLANYEELKKLYHQKEQENETLKRTNEDLQNRLRAPSNHNGEAIDNNWDWTTPELMVEETHPMENISDLKLVIKELETERNDLINQLEQLDSENQQNIAELVRIREHLQEENNNLNEKCQQLLQQNKATAKNKEKIEQQLLRLQKELHETNTSSMPSPENINEKNDEKYHELKLKLEETTKELSVLKSTHKTLEKTLEDTKKNEEIQVNDLLEKLKKSEMENKIIYSELQKTKEHVKLSEQKAQDDADNCQKLALILESYDKQVNSLKSELENIKTKRNKDKINNKTTEVLEKENKELQIQLNRALERVESLENKNNKFKSDYEEKILELQKESVELNRQLEEKNKVVAVLQEEINSFVSRENESTKKQSEDTERINKESIHNMYVNILKANLKKYIDSVSDVSSEISDDPYLLDFNKHVEEMFKIIFDCQQKCEALEKEVLQLSKEKTQLLEEKNEEIEKLIQNSEILSQDVISKGDTIKELETELTNLMTNNDILESELESYKNSGLQTISESNEDNMLLLETDLDNAKRRIKDLEQNILENGGNIKLPNESTDSMHGLGKTGEYQDLLNSHENLKVDYNTVENELLKNIKKLNQTETENEELKLQLEKIKTDYENTDYQLSEANFTIDGLKEDLDSLRLKFDEVLQENKDIKSQQMNNIDLKSEVNDIREKWLLEENQRRELESQVKGLLEKLQHSKMNETSFKLQLETLSREHAATVETKNNFEKALFGAKENLAEYEKNYSQLLQRYDSTLLKCEDINKKLYEKDNEVLKYQTDFNATEEKRQNLENKIHQQEVQLQQYQERIINDELIYNTLSEQCQKQEQQIQILTSKLIDAENSSKIENEQTHDSKEVTTNLEDSERSHRDIKNTKVQTEKINTQSTGQQTLDIDVEEKDSSGPEPSFNHNNEILLQEKEKLQEEINALQATLKQSEESVTMLQQQLQELMNVVTVKHQESLNYHNEIQRLSQILKSETEKYSQIETQLIQASNASRGIAQKDEEIDKLIDENTFLKEKCDILAKNLLDEQGKLQQAQAERSEPSQKEIALSKELDRLRSHLMEVEEHYTQELIQSEQKNADLQSRVTSLEQREKNSSTMYTSVSIRANQQVETLQNQLQLVTNQRDELRRKISDAEDANTKQSAALANLEFVLEQFQKDKERDVQKETERIRRQINVEKQIQENLKKEIDSLKEQLEESKIGLQAASRLSDQLENVKKQNTGLKDEVSQLQLKLKKCQDTIHSLTSQTDGKIEKTLIKSLVVGLLASGNAHNWNKDQAQIIKIIATVLDFNQQDHDKVKLNQPQHGSWLGSILHPQPNSQNMSQESLSQAFVKFLENESKPRVVPSLLSEQSMTQSTSSGSSKRTTPRASPIVLNEIVLPTFADFGQSRNSSSILKDVLKENNNS